MAFFDYSKGGDGKLSGLRINKRDLQMSTSSQVMRRKPIRKQVIVFLVIEWQALKDISY